MRKTKFMGNEEELKRACDEHTNAYQEIHEAFHSHLMDSPSLKRIVSSQIDGAQLVNSFEESIFNRLSLHFFDALFLSSPKELKSFYQLQKDFFSENTQKTIKFWVNHPMYWSAFMIKERFLHGIFTIVDILTGEEILLVSDFLESLISALKNDNLIYCGFISSNELCAQTIQAPIYTHLSPHDISVVLSLFNPYDTAPITREKITKDVLLHFYDITYTLFTSQSPFIKMRGYDLMYTFSLHRVEKKMLSLLDKSPLLSIQKTSPNVVSYHIMNIPKEIKKHFLDIYPDSISFLMTIKRKSLIMFSTHHSMSIRRGVRFILRVKVHEDTLS